MRHARFQQHVNMRLLLLLLGVFEAHENWKLEVILGAHHSFTLLV